MKPNDAEWKEFHTKINYVSSLLQGIEEEIGIKIIKRPTVSGGIDGWYASFQGDGLLFYNIPYEIFMAMPPQKLAVEIMRAMTIEFNEYENE